MTYKQGDVVLLPFPFTNFSTFKQRPAVIISSEKFNRRHSDVIAIAISSHIPQKLDKEDISLDNSSQKMAGLPKPSIVKISKIVTIDQRLIRKTLGNLPICVVSAIKARVQEEIFD